MKQSLKGYGKADIASYREQPSSCYIGIGDIAALHQGFMHANSDCVRRWFYWKIGTPNKALLSKLEWFRTERNTVEVP